MNAENLEALHAGLEEPGGTDALVASKGLKGGTLRIAKLPGGDPAVVLAYDQATEPFGATLRHVVYEPRIRFSLDGKPTVLAVFRLRDADAALRRYFFRAVAGLLSGLPTSPSFEEFDDAARGLVDLFHALSQPGDESIQGVWSELLLISLSADPNRLMAYWHQAPTSTYDFASPPHRLEVKSTISQTRVHRFSLEQLAVADGGFTAIASLCLREDDGGVGIDDLVDDLTERLEPQYLSKLRHVVATALGQRWRDAQLLAFDVDDAVRSFRLFSSTAVPSVTADDGVSGVKFSADLSETTQMGLGDLPKCPMFDALRTLQRYLDV